MPITRTAIIDDDGSGKTGTVIDNAWKQELYNQIDGYVGVAGAGGGVWTAYTPVWSCTGTPATIGNGTIAGRWVQIGKTVHFAIYMAAGSTSTFGPAGQIYSWTLPVTPALLGGTSNFAFSVAMFSNVGAAQAPMACYPLSAAALYCITAAGGVVGPTVPITWVAGCAIMFRGTYEVA